MRPVRRGPVPEQDGKPNGWMKRREAWGIAILSLGNLQRAPSEELRRANYLVGTWRRFLVSLDDRVFRRC